MGVAQAQQKINSREFGEWQAYESIDPGEPERSDLRAALIACTIANTARGKGRPFAIKEFLLDFDLPERKPVEEIKAKLMMWKAELSQKENKKEKKL